MSMEFQIRKMLETDWNDVARIYQSGMETNIATFQTSCPSYEEWNKSHLKECRCVITRGEAVVGWAALSPVSSRCAYTGVAELSIYMDDQYIRLGLGTKLLNFLIQDSEESGFWMLQSAILQHNEASIRLHEKCGFRQVGYRERIARDKFGIWRNTVMMERRSGLSEFD
jgi:L-amino acid N-acyltransferase YncA